MSKFLNHNLSQQANEPESIMIDTQKMESEVPDGIKFCAHMTIESEKALKLVVNNIAFCPDKKQGKAGYVIKNFTETDKKVKQIIYFFADDKYTCRRIDKLFKTKLPWERKQD